MSAWEIFFKYPPVVWERGQLVFTSPLPAWVLWVGAAVLAGLAAWAYLRARGRMRRRDAAVLLALRGALFAVLLFAALRPVLRVPVAVPHQNYLGVLIDDSRSMQIAEGEEGARGAQVQRALASGDGALIRSLSERYQVRLFRFSSLAERMSGPEELAFTGGQTRIGRALDQARSELAGLPLAGLVLISDGADRAEAELNRSLLGLRTASIPVFTVGVGRESFDRDVEVRRVSPPRVVLRGSSVAVDVVVAQTGYAGETVQLVVEDEGKIVDQQPVRLPPDGAPAAVQVRFTAGEPGLRRFRFRVPTREGELVPDNNQQEALVEVRDDRQKILYLEGEPRFEVKFMRRAVHDDPQLQLVVLQRSAEGKFLRLHVDSAAELAGGFPRTRDELFAYSGLILGSVEAGFFTPEQLRLINAFVAERGGGLLALGGRRAFAEGGYSGTPLASALPVELPARADTAFFAEVVVAPTRAGAAHAALQLAADADSSRARWAALPALTTLNRVTRLKPGAVALLAGEGAPDGQVVLAAQRYGRGLSIAFPVQDTWTWQMHADVPLDDQTHETLWRQMLRWLVSTTPDRLALSTSAERAVLGEPVRIRAELRDPAFHAVSDAEVVARVEAPDGTEQTLPMRWTVQRDGEYEAHFTPAVSGPHAVRVEARREGATLAEAAIAVEGVEDDGELFAAQMRAPLLRRIAEETGGRFYTTRDVERLPEEVRVAGSGMTMVEQRDLWDMPIVFLLIVGLMAAEWGYRRNRGMP